ncbi:hypothetical protein ACP4OV_002195 [Aristida adscensionis]
MGDPLLPMVSSSTGAMTSLLSKLPALEAQQPQLAGAVRESLASLSHVLHGFAGGRRPRDALANEWMLQVRELTYDMEDWIDHGPSKPDDHTGLWCSDVQEQVQEFMALIQDAHDRCARYGLLGTEPTSVQEDDGNDDDDNDDDDGTSSNAVAAIDPRLLYGEAPCLVGIDESRSVLVDHLMDAEKRRKVVCVVGAEGVGKTTLAMEIYRQLQGHFGSGAFVHLGRSPTVKTALISMLKQVMPDWHYEKDLWSGYNYDDMGAWEEKMVVAKLWLFLKTKSYFVVLDDVRSIWTWKVISSALPDKGAGRILVATCSKDVAKSCCIHPSDVVHQMKGLSKNDSKALFGSKIPDSEKHSLLEVSDDVLKMCDGMPLAITVAAGLFGKSASFQLDQNHSTSQGMRKILEISYGDLPLPVKSCFLYLSAFPENYTIKKDRLIRRWGAEGFIPKRGGESLWETGEGYFNELISRRLIQPAFDDDDDQPTGCTVHGVVADFMESLSEEENFVTAGAKLKCELFSCDRVRRICLGYDDEDEGDTLFSSTYCSLEQRSWVASSSDEDSISAKDEAFSLQLSQVRSLAFSGNARRIPDLSVFKLVRVLDLTDAKGLENEHLGSIGGLSLLRYLGLGGIDVTELPKQVIELNHLSTLDIRQTMVKKIPELKGTNLVSLLANGLTIPEQMGEMEKLEELSTVCFGGDGSLPEVAGLVNKLRQLRMLGVRFSYIVEKDEQSINHFLQEVGKSNLQFLFLDEYPHHLLDLLVDCWSCVRPRHLRKFELRMDWLFFFRYPPIVPLKISNLIDLTHLHIGVLEVEAEGVHALGSLPNLVLLKLYSYTSPRFSVSGEDGFQCLKVFWYCCKHGDSSTGLQFEEGAMPHLRRLLLDFGASETNFVSGIQHLSCLVMVRATIYCGPTSTDLITEAHIRDQVSQNPNNPVLEFRRKRQGRLLPRPGPPPTVKPAEESVIEIHSLDEWSIQVEEGNSTNKLVVIEFTATWCPASRIIAPFFADLAKKFANVIFLKVDIDEMDDIAEQFDVTGAPIFLFMKGGDVRERVRGAKKEELVRKLELQMAE